MKKVILILSTVAVFFSCKEKTKVKTDVLSKNPTVLDTIDKRIDSLYNVGTNNGFAVALVDDSKIIYNKGFGFADTKNKKPYTKNTIINIASVSKVFIGVALLKAVELELLNLDDPINKHLPFKVYNPKYPKQNITIRQLATHTSTIVDADVYLQTCYVNKDDVPLAENLKEDYGLYYQNPSTDWMPLKEYLKQLLEEGNIFYNITTFADRKPGDLYEYSNIGAALCALVIESAAKKPFYGFTKEHIFQPLKMEATSWLFNEVNVANYSKLYTDDHLLPYYTILSYPDGGLITSSTDLSLFLIEIIKGYAGNGTILHKESYQELFRPQLDRKAIPAKKNKGFNLGLFFELEADYNVIGHTGGDPGTNVFMYFNNETKIGRMLITNTDSQKEGSDKVFYGIWNTLGTY